ncbi:glycosyltransferase involved in cell wall biosynthesis [Paenibacillus cellulosilyticus]|uniref:Glycosyltransferase involved in cell wall biosynthesis n=1 Tax=Paenibacillus cellulosilyticus TaxID=375489 RepID=A0A2V2YYL6_9BACL|nr:glycosyltransferase family 4 protein [Paenibacillus cellulosilyticus]PWW07348.1 glycosyltransferase involved in cell wall biosynthesis [Paenibacillus cellulosilyticus]QKS44474.1 glycosyltransferase family 4 protein [Paenibacillus cellulosilyticus]
MRSKPRLFAFSHICSHSYITGAEKLLLFMLKELLPYFHCTLVVPNTGYLSVHAAKAGVAITVQPIPISVPLYLGQSHLMDELHEFRSRSDYAALVHLLAEQRPDAVLVNTSVHPMPAIAAKELGIPVVWMLMEAIRLTPYTSLSAALIERYSDWIVGISESTLQPIKMFFPHLTHRMMLLPPSWHIDTLHPASWLANRENRRNRLAIKHQHKLIGFIASSIYENKGFIPYIKMAVDVAARHPNAMFLVVGNPVDRPLFDSGIDMARQAGLLERFRWIQFEDQIETIYPAFDLLIVPSLTAEGFGLTALEGLIFKKPVIAFASGGLAEIMAATGNTTNAVPVGDVGGLIARVDAMLTSTDLYAIGERNAHAAEIAYGLTAYRVKLLRLLDMMRRSTVTVPHLVRGSLSVIYLLEGGVLRPFRSEAAVLEAGYSLDQVMEIDDATIDALPKGEPIGRSELPIALPTPAPPMARQLSRSRRRRQSSRTQGGKSRNRKSKGRAAARKRSGSSRKRVRRKRRS